MSYPGLEPNVTPYEYVGEVQALGSLTLTQLARSFEQIEVGTLTDWFPDRNINERTIVVEQILEGLGTMPIVRVGVPSGSFAEGEKLRAFSANPAFMREDDFLDQYLINQLRKPGTWNEQYRPTDIIADRVRKLVARHKRTLDMMRSMVLLGGINYTEPRTNTSINVSTNIPAHNFFRYDGYDASAAAGATLAPGITAFKALSATKNRKEALLFTGANDQAGVPWTHPQANIVRTLRLIKQFLYKTNKNRFTDIVMSSDLYTILHENEYVKAYMGQIGLFGNGGNAGGSRDITTSGNGTVSPAYISYGPGGDIEAIAGLRIRVMDGLYRHPETGQITNYWPSHKVALVAPRHYSDPSATLGFTWHCVGEAPDGTPGVWMRVGPDQMPPAVPGRTMQMGDAALPVAIYPHWISILDVCEPGELQSNMILNSMEDYGTF